jgi:phosphoglycolate phosphatase-like HAD superfamily hydrolase
VGEVQLLDLPSRHGKTDRQIVREYLEAANVDSAELARVTQRLEALSKRHYVASKTARQLLPGIKKALTAAASLGFTNALFTGNSQSRAEVKLDGAGLERKIFDWNQSFFGSTHEDRPAMARYAARRVKRGVIIGDTPADGVAAQVAGFAFIGVATGIYPEEVLLAANPVACLHDLDVGYGEFAQVMAAIADEWR